MRALFISILSALSFVSTHAQEKIEPGSNTLNQSYLKPRNIFQKLSWFDKDGVLTNQAVLNCITKVDTINKKLIYLQIRNDGKKDSTIAEWPTLKAIYTSTVAGNKTFVYEHHEGRNVKNITTSNGRVESDTSFTVASPYFDSYLTDYLIGALPLKPGYHGQFRIGVPGTAAVTIKDVFVDVITSANSQPIQAYVVQVDYNGYNVTYWIDKASGEMLKSIFLAANGSIFMKSKV